ncbi:DUF7147 family protein [Pontibacillus litoralis]|uniref:Methylthioribose kinase n=1 Tax=Pontibacillus litoralis JSM 072002 TaxID=1385512 RepID=A0A0A5GBU6_9BACI|nr:hypothetical protein [Pontibacillus litoralis]KGX88565.1 Methylthioribose kinase [Pontibacillus litoralis JSM 072002]
MIQRFIELGEGYSDIYELLTIAQSMPQRIQHIFAFHTVIKDEKRTSLAISMHPTTVGDFQPIYICREGIPFPHDKANKRYELMKKFATSIDKDIIELTVQPSHIFNETELYYNHLIGVLRMNRYIAPLT